MKTTHYGSAFPKRWYYYLNDTEIEEPLEWRDVIFDFGRNQESDGVVMMPSVPITLGGRGAELVRSWIYNRQAEQPLTLRIEYLELDGSRTVYFEGDLSSESFADHADSVEIETEENGLENEINANAKVTYEIPTDNGDGDGRQTYTHYDRVGFRLEFSAQDRDGTSRYLVPTGTQAAAEHPMALPVTVNSIGNPFRYSDASPDVLEAATDQVLTLQIAANMRPAGLTVNPDPDNTGTVALSEGVGGDWYLALVVYGANGQEKSVTRLSNRTNALPEYLTLAPRDLVTVEVRGMTFGTTASASGDNYLVFDYGKIDAAKPLLTITATQQYRGEAVDIPDISVRTAFERLMRLASNRPGLVIEWGEGLELVAHRLFTTGHAVGRDTGVIKTSFEDFRSFFRMLGVGIVFEFYGGVERCRVVYNYRTGNTAALWPVSASAQIAAVGDGWSNMDMEFSQNELFTGIEIGWDKVGDYKLIPYKQDPCGKSAYVNAQVKSSDVEQLLCHWRADAFGLEDALMRAELEGAGAVGDLDTVWVMDCRASSGANNTYALFRPNNNSGLFLPGATTSTLVNMRLRPAALMAGIRPRLAVPVAFLSDKSYTWASASNEITLEVNGQPDNAPIDVQTQPAHLPLCAAFSSSVGVNLWALMQDTGKRYGYITFDYRGVTLKGFIRTVKYNPTEESSQRCELYLTPDSDLSALIK